uniref:G protein-coupled receptor n=1 Tax=Ditylenchus dipsaci TaxID=166011 RepID=A0A915DNP6_9BILA
MVILTYFIIIFTSIMIFLKMKRSLNMLTSKRSREFNIQISVALVVQAFMPIIFALFPSGLLASASVGKSEIAELLSLSSSFLLSWSPVINPFATIMIVKPYRLVFCMSQNKTEVSLTKVISRVSPRTTNRPLVVTHITEIRAKDPKMESGNFPLESSLLELGLVKDFTLGLHTSIVATA